MTDLPQLLDCKGVMAELGVTRGVAESLMRDCDKYPIGRRVFVARADVARALDERRTDPQGHKRKLVA